MAVNKVVYDGTTLIDLTGITVTADTLAKGTTAVDKSGTQITGTMESGGSDVSIETITFSPTSATSKYTINGLKGKPIVWKLFYAANLTATTTRYLVSAYSDGANRLAQVLYRSGSSGLLYYGSTYFTDSYSNGSLTIQTLSSCNFYKGTYRLIYVY